MINDRSYRHIARKGTPGTSRTSGDARRDAEEPRSPVPRGLPARRAPVAEPASAGLPETAAKRPQPVSDADGLLVMVITHIGARRVHSCELLAQNRANRLAVVTSGAASAQAAERSGPPAHLPLLP
ncbi:hypothetical protein GCM10022214_69720 [Actinomadura miaoliensis]|uniref:Uncharacterized protein n=1 Tax=Actinomadura miaoliensis TaxID=430685 RepID=A0ABP7WT57_9ACTN